MINKQTTRDKQLLAWDRERLMLEERLRHPPVQILAEPIQQGWKRHFVLSPEARLRPDAAVLAAILEKINTVVYHWRRDFLPSRRQVRQSRRTLSSEQFLCAVGIRAWEWRVYPDDWLWYFRRELVPCGLVFQASVETLRHKWVRPHRWERRSGHVLAFVFRYPRLFTLKTERHWLTHLKQLEPEVAVPAVDGTIPIGGRKFCASWPSEKCVRTSACPARSNRPMRPTPCPHRAFCGGGMPSAAVGWKPFLR